MHNVTGVMQREWPDLTLGGGTTTLAPNIFDWMIDHPASRFSVNPLMVLAERTFNSSVSVG